MKRQSIITLYASLMKRAFFIFAGLVLVAMMTALCLLIYQHSNTREAQKISYNRDVERAFDTLQEKIEHKTLFIAKGLEDAPQTEELALLDRLSDQLPSLLSYHYSLVSDPARKKEVKVSDSEFTVLHPIPESPFTSLLFTTSLSEVEKVLGVPISISPRGDGKDSILKMKNGQNLYFYNPMGDFFFSFSKRYHYEVRLLVYLGFFLVSFFAFGTGVSYFMGRKKTVASLLSLSQELSSFKSINGEMEKEILMLKEHLLYQKNRDTQRKRMRSFLEKYYNQRLKKLKDLSALLSRGLENGSLDHDESSLIAEEIKELTGLLYERTFETRLQDQLNMVDLWEKVKGHLMPTLMRVNVSLNIEKIEQSLLLESDEKFMELFFYAQIKSLLARLYQDAAIDVRMRSLKNTLEVCVQVKGVLLSPSTQNMDESIDLGFMKLTMQQIDKLGKSLKVQMNILEDGHLIFVLPVKAHNLPKREIKSGNVIKLHA